ncbi:MAG TPA: DUF58 domain-containing protein [Phycisphaerales bacterium]|nr:DUF58 domain-containing protein [Phycisphaerales bacterium]HMP37643.1 DUF58 domain-containing protein [Phycisphaerales bacterium]
MPATARPTRVDELIDSRLMAKLDQVDVVSRKIFAGKLQGERRSKRRGASVEFADYRHYAAGDDLRFVDWNIYARLDKLFLKMFLEEEDLSLLIVVDASASMDSGDPDKFTFCQRLAMALGYIGLANHNRVTAWSFGGLGDSAGVQRLANLRGRRRTQELGQWLIGRVPGGPSGFDEAMRTIALARQGKGVMVILSDFFLKEGYEKGLRYLAGGGYDTFLIQVLSPQEFDPSKGGIVGDMKLVDCEDGDVAEITMTPALLRRYRETVDAYCGALRDFAVRRDMVQMTISSDLELDTLLMEYLRRRGLLR